MTDVRVQLTTWDGGNLKRGKGGGFTVYNCEAKDVVRILVEALEKHGFKTTGIKNKKQTKKSVMSMLLLDTREAVREFHREYARRRRDRTRVRRYSPRPKTRLKKDEVKKRNE